MLNRLAPHKRIVIRELVHRLDRVARDLNIVLLVFALGLAVLDMTFFVTRDIVDRLPPLTQVADVPAASPSK